MGTEQERGKIITTATSGESQLQTRGYVDFGSLVDAVSNLSLSEKKASRIKRIFFSGGTQIWNLLSTGGAITAGGRIVAMGEGDRNFIETFFISKPEKVITHASGAQVEEIARFRDKNELYLRPGEKVIILRENAVSQLGFDVYKSGSCNLRFTETADDKVEYEGVWDADSLSRAVTKRFTMLYKQTGIPFKRVVSPETLSRQLLLNIAEKSGRSVLKKS